MQSAAKTTEFRPDELVDFVLENEFLIFFSRSRVGENFENGNRTFPLSFIFLFFFFLSYSVLGIKKKIERKIMKREIMKMSK